MYKRQDLAGFCVGVVEKDAIRPLRNLAAGDVVLGLPSAGLHSNGHSLARKVVLDHLALPLDGRDPRLGDATVGDALLTPTIIYTSGFIAMRDAEVPWKAAAHITGGGLVENPPRVFADDALAFELDPTTWAVPGIMQIIAAAGVERHELRRTFNMGIGMVVIVAPEHAAAASAALAAYAPRPIGTLVARGDGPAVRFLGD